MHLSGKPLSNDAHQGQGKISTERVRAKAERGRGQVEVTNCSFMLAWRFGLLNPLDRVPPGISRCFNLGSKFVAGVRSVAAQSRYE